MPLPTLLCIAFGCGIAAAYAAETEIRLSFRSFLLTGGFTVYLIFIIFLIIPISVYFYIFHGDWFLLYLIDVDQIPSAIALLGFLVEGVIGISGFWLGTVLIRSQRVTAGYVVLILCLLLGVSVLLIFPDRLRVIGSYAQYHGNFGLIGYRSSTLMKGTITIGINLAIGIAFLVIRLRFRNTSAS